MRTTEERPRLACERFVERMTDHEYERAQRVTRTLPSIAERAVEADQTGEFQTANITALRSEGVLGLMVPPEYGGQGGGLRDLAASCYSVATACPSTALAYFFHSSAVSRGLLAVEAADAGLFSDPRDEAAVRSFGRKILSRMGSGHYRSDY